MTDLVSQKYALNLPHVVRYLLFVRETLAIMIKSWGSNVSFLCRCVTQSWGLSCGFNRVNCRWMGKLGTGARQTAASPWLNSA